MEKVRVLRIIEYVGERDWVEETLKFSSVPLNGTKHINKSNVIKSAIIDTFPELLDKTLEEEQL